MRELYLVGPLAAPGVFEAVTGVVCAHRPARLAEHALVGETDAAPAVVARRGGAVEGRLVARPDTTARDRLESYAATLGLSERKVEIVLPGDDAVAAALLAPEAEPDAPDWCVEAWRERWSESWPLIAAEIALHMPPMTPGSFARQKTMMAVRAQSRLRAARAPAPATLRREAAPGDFTWRPDAPLAGQFFKLAGLRIDHARFDGGRAEALPREVLVGVDACLVLPYDPRRDRVLLVEQFRTGPVRRGASNPWSLEPVAGIVDPGETPEAAGLRESFEEAGLRLDALIPIFGGYPSPGSNTDYFHCYLALADLPREESWRGGLAEEHEDLRLHAISFARAMDLVQSGEIDVIPMQGMLYWLAHHRARLRADAGVSDA